MTWDHLHDEDVLFQFRGRSADELEPGRFYEGTVDGFADFGVFVTIGESVTGLLHRSNIDGRLENLEWEVGDTVIVQVEGVRDNGNVDLTWSIRQSSAEFRGAGVHDPSGDDSSEIEKADEESAPRDENEIPAHDTEPAEPEDISDEKPSEPEETPQPGLRSIDIQDAEEGVDSRARINGRVTNVRQTNGPTIFTVQDATGHIECAAFEAAGVRAFPEITADDVVTVVGRVERHRGNLQIETESIEALEGEERAEVLASIRSAEAARNEPEDTSLVVSLEGMDGDELTDTATALRGAVFEQRSIVIRHPTTVDGVVAGAAIEHALRSFAAKVTEDDVNVGWFVTRRPIDSSWYGLGDAMYDVSDGTERDDVVILVGAGAGSRDEPAIDFLDVYETDHFVVDTLDTDVRGYVSALAVNVAGMIDADIRSELVHLPAIAAGEHASEPLADLARKHGHDSESVEERHDAIALVAYYQRYDDKRELIADLLFDGEEAGELAGHVSEQFRQRLGSAVNTALENADEISTAGGSVMLLDASSLSHRYAFPPRPVLAEALYDEADTDIVLVLDEDAAFLATGQPIDLEQIAATVDATVENASVEATRDRLTFLAGKRSAVRDAIVEAAVAELE